MNKLQVLLFGIFFLLLISSCSKDNIAAKKLNGSWELTSFNVNNTELVTALTNGEVTFSERSANGGRFNTKLFALGLLLQEASGTYTVSNNGKNITLDDDNGDPGTGTIVDLTDTYLHTTYVDGDGNNVVFKADKK